MQQENHSFDNYFGMLNPYRKANGWNIGDDGIDYEVDGIDDKLTTISNLDDEGTSYQRSSSSPAPASTTKPPIGWRATAMSIATTFSPHGRS